MKISESLQKIKNLTHFCINWVFEFFIMDNINFILIFGVIGLVLYSCKEQRDSQRAINEKKEMVRQEFIKLGYHMVYPVYTYTHDNCTYVPKVDRSRISDTPAYWKCY